MRPILFASLLLLAAAPVRAQAVDSAYVGDPGAGTVLAPICPGATVRLYLAPPGGPVQGRCGAVMDGRLVVLQENGERAVEVASVGEVWVRERATARGAWIGAAAGAGTLVLAGAMFTSLLCESSDCTDDYVLVLQVGTLVGGGTGAVLGGAIGYLTKRWVRRYP